MRDFFEWTLYRVARRTGDKVAAHIAGRRRAEAILAFRDETFGLGWLP